ncbi:peroxisomal biogenesis factor 6 [Prunus yedoensis var. nudiflora]|uniref:Peroxisomal biogenesis factor 6 n=1 Tax=Prunus yedoensis var. nudiflora TaxID=2094558 RepID=A0A314YMG5_PRUYE|nr:peroxisomal biogenesis factor 6 [Prunus yedoensis var. nudiflora]
MEQKGILLSALGVGMGVGVGLGLASGQTMSKWAGNDTLSNALTPDRVEQELLRQIVDGRDSKVTFDQFPYYLSEQTRVLITSAAYVHLKRAEVSKYTRNLSPASRAILLSGPAELYQQQLAKALAHYFQAKLLLLDVTNFSLKIQSKYGSSNKASSFKRSTSEATLERLSGLFGSFSIFPQREEPTGTLRRQSSGVDIRSSMVEGSSNPSKLRRNASASANISNLASQSTPANSAPLRRTSSWSFDEKLLIQSLYRVLVFVSNTCPIVLPPENESHLVSWKTQLEEDMKMIQVQDNKNHIMEVLSSNDLDCDDLGSICIADTIDISNYIEEIVVSAVSYHLMNNKDPEYRNGKLVISSKSLSHGLNIFQEGKYSGKDTLKLEAKAETLKEAGIEGAVGVNLETKTESAAPENKSGGAETLTSAAKTDADNPIPISRASAELDNEFEKRIRPEVIPANEIGVTFADIGALDEIKESLQELVMLPLRRPDLFNGGLLKPCRGILLFGPPGSGKTMLAKAIAREAGASFINVSMSTITSKWFGEDEKNVRALFTLAAKVSPTIIFVDEVDSMLGQRTRFGEHEAMRKIKNEFMTHWDGLLSNQGDRILVLAATNRPFDLDEAIIRRFERRILVGLPTVENREMILRTLLSKEKVEARLDFKELATMTEGFSGSDLKNLCTTAAYRPVRELIQAERKKDLEKKQRAAGGQNPQGAPSINQAQSSEGQNPEAVPATEEHKEERVITLRPLNMEDFKQAKSQVSASFASEGAMMNELKQWNDQYGEGGSRKREQLTYFL